MMKIKRLRSILNRLTPLVTRDEARGEHELQDVYCDLYNEVRDLERTFDEMLRTFKWLQGVVPK